MSGCSSETDCPNCGKDADLYVDWKPFESSMIMMFPMTEKERKYKEMEREALERVNGIVFKDGCFNTNLPDSFNYALGYVDSKYISRSYIPDDIQIPKCKR